ncbi:hypothetical protein SUGI_0776800 [Cryptomeria japonica]|uniref:lysine-specific demethylase JMJ703 n=1 Tax=Cryptomeria japonica TaxID=3369 RepID=UPI002414B5F2|nr:lysine-specific demethylase JMJ703 [Cryptomeria japonica]XP_057848984.2 lysine-specific demethylase JMJ703 [Cryptomeria japonica]XP_057848985.2 lysine-specific demethylase JMJ703 [Cryptomeria japonica]GLJ38155.1 hypothetical protein SUGI_0776800 [Cryptomeria japonica]
MGSGHAEACMTEDETSSSMYTTNLSLPKGVVRGCPRCDGCQKVLARWLPDGGHRPTLETAPTFHPNEEEFKDTLKYIASIRPIAEPHGICRIVPPPSWKPPCPLRDKVKWQKTRFHTRVQQIHKLQTRQAVLTNVDGGRHKRRRLSQMTRDFRQEELYVTNFGAECLASKEDDFGFDPGPEFTLEAFQKYATEFKDQYFRSQDVELNSDCIVLEGSKGRFAPSVENIEGEYWRVVEKPTEQIEVLYGADVETRSFGSGFPKEQVGAPKELADPYLTSGWNLNNIARLPGSMLSFEEGDISGVVVPWVYIGMCFSSFCWHVEDHHFYSLNYLHWGAPKVWYGVPGYAAVKLENAMRKHLPHLFKEQPDLLQKLVTQLSPSILKCEGVPVYRCVQQAGEFILTFPRAYHAGFNCGFNCAEAVNVAPVDWLPHGQIATELYQELFRKTSVSHDKLLLGASREAVKILWEFSMFGKYTSACAGWHGFCGKDGLLTKALKARVERETARREFLPNLLIVRKMDRHFDMKERECFACYYDLHLSAVGCGCCPEIFACLEHVNQLCSCDWSKKFFLYRYDVSELYILIEALGGKRSSINRWANQDLGLTSASSVNLLKTQEELLQEPTSPLSSSNSMPTLRENSLRGPPLISEAPNVQDRSIGKDLPRAKGSQAATCVETIVLSDDEEDADINCREEKIEENIHELDRMRDFDNIDHCNERTAVDISSAEKHFNKDIIEQKEQYMVNTSFTHREHFLNMDSAAPEELTTDQDQLKKHELQQGRVSYILPNSNRHVDTDSIPEKSQSHIEAPFMQDVELQMQLPTETSFQSMDSISTNLSDRAALGGRHFNCQKPLYTTASECIITMEHSEEVPRTNHVENDSNVISVDIDPLDVHADHSSAGVLPACASYDVHVLDVGVIEPCKPWYDSETIFPRGFKSCVTFYSVLDPAEMCTYISEVLDAGLKQPVFKVTIAGHPTEVFMHISIQKCWELVVERLNKEITRQRSIGKKSIPHLPPPESLNGLEMFGFTSPLVVHAIETIDHGHKCTDYWAARSSTSQVKCVGRGGSPVKHYKEADFGILKDSNISPNEDLPSEIDKKDELTQTEQAREEPNLVSLSSSENVYVVLEKLFKRARPNELWTLHKVLSGEACSPNWKAAFRALAEELKKL